MGMQSMEARPKKRKRPANGTGDAQKKAAVRRALPPHKYILAPMVGGSELAFRLLCRRYATRDLLCYTPMMSSERFATEASYRAEAFQTSPQDRPLVAHFSGNDPATLLAAAKHIESQVDAVDLNLGCPQRIAHSGHFGSFLLDEVDRQLVCSIVRTLARGLTVPVFVKIRLLETTEKTIELCTQLRDAGASLIAIHARHRVNLVGRSGPGARDGAAMLEEVDKVVRAVKGVAIISNGNVKTFDDVRANLSSTGANGVMSAEGILDDPALFWPTKAEAAGGAAPDESDEAREVRRLRKKLRQIDQLEAKGSLTEQEQAKVAQRAAVRKKLKLCKKNLEERATPSESATLGAPSPKPSPLVLASEYLELAEQCSVPMRTVVFHTRRIAKQALTQFQLMAEILEATDLPSVRKLVKQCIDYEAHGYTPDPDKARREREALELKKWREETRKRYEERMTRKAVRAGLPKDHYLSQGAEVPTADSLRELRAMQPAAAWEQWKARHGQHCWALHMQDGGCPRARTCAFLHADVAGAREPAWHG